MLAHVLLGGGAVVLLLVTGGDTDLLAAAGPLAVSMACFVLAQASLFAALRRVEASTVAPLLSVKIAVLAGVAWWIHGRGVTPMAAFAIALAIAGAAVVGGVGHRPDRRSLGLILLAVTAYAGCDTGIVIAIERVLPDAPDGVDRLLAAMRCMGAMYAGLGLLAAGLLPWVLRRPAGAGRWRGAAVYAACWGGAMVTLFGAFSLIPIVLVSILQSTRSLWAVLLGGLLGRAGFSHLETDHPAGLLAVRVIGAVSLVTAVGLYAWATAAS